MKIFKVFCGVVLFLALVAVVQLADPAPDSPVTTFQRLPDVSLKSVAEAEWAAGRTGAALLLLDYLVDQQLPEAVAATQVRQQVFAQLAADNSPVSRLKATGWAAAMAGGNTFESLAGSTVADAVLYGDIAAIARAGGFSPSGADEFSKSLAGIRTMAEVFPPADGAITLLAAAHAAGALNEALTRQLTLLLALMQPEPKSALSVEKFKENIMPLFELAKRCRTWGEFEVITRQAVSPDQLKVLTKIVSPAPAAAKRLGQILTVASREGTALAAKCIDTIMRRGSAELDVLHASLRKGAAGVRYVTEHPGLAAPSLASARAGGEGPLSTWQQWYHTARFNHGPIVAAAKYLLIALLCGLLVLVVVPGGYLEKLIARPGSVETAARPSAVHYTFSALAVGLVLSGLLYLLTQAVRPALEPAAMAAAVAGEGGAVAATITRADSAFLSGIVVLLSLVIHAMVWFFARGKIREVEDEDRAAPALRLKRLENLDIFLDLPLFTGLALTVVAFILITLDAGMSRHFAYTSTVVGILSAVSLRVRYVYPLRERLIHEVAP